MSRRWLVPAAVLEVLVLAYLLDLLATRETLPEGCRSPAYRWVVEPGRRPADPHRRAHPGPGQGHRHPGRVGAYLTASGACRLRVNWDATVAAAADQPLSPLPG